MKKGDGLSIVTIIVCALLLFASLFIIRRLPPELITVREATPLEKRVAVLERNQSLCPWNGEVK